MRFSGIVACILTAAAACTPCLALNTTNAGAAAARSQAPALARTAKAKSPKKAEQPAQQSYHYVLLGEGGGRIVALQRIPGEDYSHR